MVLKQTERLGMPEHYESRFDVFFNLMKFRVREILLVSSSYDAFVLEEDGRLSDRLFSEYADLNLSSTPRIQKVASAKMALESLEEAQYDLVITTTRLTDMNPLDFGKQVKAQNPDMPVVLLTYEWLEADFLKALRESCCIDKIFYWAGDTAILLAVIKYIEDLKNVDNDFKQGVTVALIVEDSPRFYSMFLPIVYKEIMTQTQMLISEGVNFQQRLLRMRARPKILMAETFEEGMRLYEKYQQNLLGVISDVEFSRRGKIDRLAGFKLAERVRADWSDLPILLQSSKPENAEMASRGGLIFLDKNSQNLLDEVRRFILSNFGFGDFIFKDARGKEVARAGNLSEFADKVLLVPEESLLYHARRNHIAFWLRARTEFECARRLRPVKISDFQDTQALREFIVTEIHRLINRSHVGVITDFGKARFDLDTAFTKLGAGSLGGKARSIAFINALLAQTDMKEKFPDVDIKIPKTYVICSETFDRFIGQDDLRRFAITESDNNRIAEKFLGSSLPGDIMGKLQTLIRHVTYPLAVRSSSLLEDSQTLPFAGLYSTYMLPNNHPDMQTRLTQLANAVKLVYASVFYKSPKEYVRNANFRIEEEKMAVIIQEIVGQEHHGRLYPVISGVAQSYNFYPISHMEPGDGIVQLALGLGAAVVEGSQTYRFSPRYPQTPPPFSSAHEFLEKSQTYFYALDLSNPDLKISNDEKYSLLKLDLSVAEADGTLFFVGSTFCGEDNVIKDSLSIPGPRLVTFANVLKNNIFPLAGILKEILHVGRYSLGADVEIEFAVNLFKDKERKPEFYMLQIRPMVAGREDAEVAIKTVDPARVICMSEHCLGNGVIKDIHDIVYVDPGLFNAAKTRLIAEEIGQINRLMREKNRDYILIGFGRWATSDPWLGIPVEWHQISKARVVIESNLDGFNIEPSLGSHFFHNMISLRMGYFHIQRSGKSEFIDWDWLQKQKISASTAHVRQVHLAKALEIRIDARYSRGIIVRS